MMHRPPGPPDKLMPHDLLIRNGHVVLPDGVRPADIAIVEGLIVELRPGMGGSAAREIDAEGLHVFPGLIDPHVHFNEPGRTDWEGIDTGSAALSAGGGTCFFDMPLNASPPTLDGEGFDLKLRAALASSRTDFALWGGLTPGNLDRLEELADRGVVGFKAFMSGSGIDDFERADDLTLLRGMEKAARLGLPVAVHAESDDLTNRLSAEAKQSGRTAIRDYLNSRPVVAETDAIRRAILFAAETGCKLHIVHVSSPAGIAEIVKARAERKPDGSALVDVSAETCPHYLLLTDADVERLGAPAKCAPPLRPEALRAELWRLLIQGQIDLVASDHSPAPASMKESTDFFAVWGGVAGVQSTLSLLLSGNPELPLEKIAALTASNVADRFGIAKKGRLEVGCDADLSLVDVAATGPLTREQLLDRHRLSPYVGRTLRGTVRRTLVRGQTVFEDGKVSRNAQGRLVKPLTNRRR